MPEMAILQVVDMKTTGCLYGFNFDDPKHGTALQQFSGDLHNFHPSSQQRNMILLTNISIN